MPLEQVNQSLSSASKDSLQRLVQRHSPHRLPRKKLVLPGGITISAERHKGRVMVRVEVPEQAG